ncbi:MAG: hypothetical protein JWP34_3150 [Massilia sp.]|nr:hypothetical protein [Massilia sp.]
MTSYPTRIPCFASLAVCLATLSLPSEAAPQREASLDARVASCDTATSRSAVGELLRGPETLREPLMLFHAALSERTAGRNEEAAFLFVAARLRTSRQILFEQGDTPQLLATMMMTVGPLIMPVLEADPELARRVVRRTIDWDRSTPDPFRDRQDASSGENARKIAEIDDGLRRLPDQIRANTARIAKAREENETAERQLKNMYAERCGSGILEPVAAEAATTRIQGQAELFAKAHPLVLRRAGGAVKSASVTLSKMEATRLPSRLTVYVTPAAGTGFYAEVAAIATVTPDRKLGSVKFSLNCIADVQTAQRQPAGKDVCRDPNANKPTDTADADLSRFDIGPDGKSQVSPPQEPVCGFPGLQLPADFAVFAAGAYSGRRTSSQIDQSGHQATQIDVAVNNPDKPVVLILGAYEPTIWNVGWSKETRILAVLVGGYHRQAIAGLDKSTPLLVSSRDEKGPCGYFSMSGNLTELNPLSRRMFGRPVDLVYPAIKGQADVGKPMPPGATLVRSRDVTPESFHDKNAPLAGEAGLEDAVRQGLLRKATEADAEAWAEAVIQHSPQRDIPPVAGQERPKRHQLRIDKGYVVLKPFVYPSGLQGAHSARFIIPKGAPKPAGNPGHSTVYDFNTLNCQGPACGARR